MAIAKKVLSDEDLTDKGRKNLVILDTIRKNGPLARTDVSKITGINIVTVSNYIDNYIKAGLVVQRGLDTSTGGRRPLLVELNSQAGYVIGVGINVAEVIGIVTDLSSKVIFKFKKERPLETGEKLVKFLLDFTGEIIEKASVDISKIKGIGVGIPGVVNKERHTVHWQRGLFNADVSVSVSVSDIFEKKLKITTLVDNDANVAVLGEKWLTLEPGIKNLLYMYAGLGCGIMIDGKIYRGTNGCAGEFLLATEADYATWMRHTHQTDIWGIEIGLVLEAKRFVKDNPSTTIAKMVGGDAEKINFSTIVKAAKEKDPLVMEWVERIAGILGRKIAFLINLLNPEIIVIGGGIEEIGTHFLESVKKMIKATALEEATRKLKVIPARLGEEAVALGAASLVVQNIFIDA